MNMAPLVLLPCLLFYKFKDKRCLYTAVFSAAGILLWIGIAMTTVQVREPKMSDIIVYYLSHPADFFSIMFHTLTNTDKLKFYRNSFIGTLGWLDAPLPRTAVTILGCSLLIMFALNIRKMRQKFLPLALTATAFICLFSTFVILLVQWTKFPDAEEIEGIQGRYFIPVAIMLGYALCAETENKIRNYISAGLFFFFAVFSQIETINTLLLRYWMN